MEDREIIKALECCSSFDKECKGCPLERMFDCNCINYNCKYALDLINRQKAEIERLKELIDVRHKVFETKCEELEIAKAEAYKECVEKVKEEIAEALKSNYKARAEREQKIPVYTETEFLGYCSGKIDCLRELDDFCDNFLKELVGDSDV